MKYLFFVQNGKVTRVPFAVFLRLAERYAQTATDKWLAERQVIANTLMSKFHTS